MSLSEKEELELLELEEAEYQAQKSSPKQTGPNDGQQESATRVPKLESAARSFAQAGSLGFSDEIAGLGEAAGRAVGIDGVGGPMRDLSFNSSGPTLDWQTLRDAYRRATAKERVAIKKDLKENPGTTIVAGLAGAIASPANALARGVSMAKSGAGLGAAAGLGTSEEDSVSGMVSDTAKGAALGGALGYAGDKAVALGGKVVDTIRPYLAESAKIKPKVNVAQIDEAASRLGVNATPGMRLDSEVLQGLESSLAQSPSVAGFLTRKGTKPVLSKIDDITKEALSDGASGSMFSVGENVKKGITDVVSKRAEAPKKVFNEIAESAKDIGLNEKSLLRVSKNIQEIDGVQLMPGSPAASVAKRYSDGILNAKSAKDVSSLRKMAGAELRAAEGSEKMVLGNVYEKLTRLEENSLMRGAVDTMRGLAKKPSGKTGDALASEGADLGKSLVSDMRGAKRDYRGLMSDVQEVSQNARMKKTDTLESFISNLDDIKSENIVDKLFNTDDKRLLDSVKKYFPEQFETLRRGRVGSIAKDSRTASGKLMPSKFMQQIKDMGDESMSATFGGGNVAKIKDSKILAQAVPDRMGPSGTPQGNQYLEMFNPALQVRELGRYAMYKGLSGDAARKLHLKLVQSEPFAKMAVENPKAFSSMVIDITGRIGRPKNYSNVADSDFESDRKDTPSVQLKGKDTPSVQLKGKEKWASDGFEKLQQHKPNSTLDKGAMLSDPKLKDLLIQASDLKPGSIAMTKVLSRIENRNSKGQN